MKTFCVLLVLTFLTTKAVDGLQCYTCFLCRDDDKSTISTCPPEKNACYIEASPNPPGVFIKECETNNVVECNSQKCVCNTNLCNTALSDNMGVSAGQQPLSTARTSGTIKSLTTFSSGTATSTPFTGVKARVTSSSETNTASKRTGTVETQEVRTVEIHNLVTIHNDCSGGAKHSTIIMIFLTIPFFGNLCRFG